MSKHDYQWWLLGCRESMTSYDFFKIRVMKQSHEISNVKSSVEIWSLEQVYCSFLSFCSISLLIYWWYFQMSVNLYFWCSRNDNEVFVSGGYHLRNIIDAVSFIDEDYVAVNLTCVTLYSLILYVNAGYILLILISSI